MLPYTQCLWESINSLHNSSINGEIMLSAAVYGNGSVINVLKSVLSVYAHTGPRPENGLFWKSYQSFLNKIQVRYFTRHCELIKCGFTKIWDANRISCSRSTKVRVQTSAANPQCIKHIEFWAMYITFGITQYLDCIHHQGLKNKWFQTHYIVQVAPSDYVLWW
jgi:hypothetical protein